VLSRQVATKVTQKVKIAGKILKDYERLKRETAANRPIVGKTVEEGEVTHLRNDLAFLEG